MQLQFPILGGLKVLGDRSEIIQFYLTYSQDINYNKIEFNCEIEPFFYLFNIKKIEISLRKFSTGFYKKSNSIFFFFANFNDF